jgi:hypothetical protein
MSTIPASLFVNVVPSVLPAGGAALDVNCVVMTEGTRVPVGSVYSFGSAAAVADFFGSSSAEAIIAGGGTNLGGGYFAGFTNSDALPGSLLFAQYPKAAVQAYLQSGNVGASLTIAQLQAITGTLLAVVDGVSRNAGTIDLSAAASYSAAAATLQTDFNASLATIANLTGVISGSTLTASAVTGVIAPGQQLVGAGIAASIYVVSQLGGTPGGAGSYQLSASNPVGSEAMTTKPFPVAVTYDSQSGGFLVKSGVSGSFSTIAFATGTAAAGLLMTQATGAVLSQGSNALTPSQAMELVVAQTTNWVTYLNATNPDSSGNALKLAFAAWKNAYPNRYAYICWDTDVLARSAPPQVTTLGALLDANGDSGTFLLSELTDLNQAAFVAGAAASIDFEEVAGRITFAFKGQAGLTADVTSGQTAINLCGNPQNADEFGNGYNYYGAVGSAATNFLWLQRGVVTGSFRWFDSYINQVVMNNTFQGALLNLQSNAKSIPYTVSGDNLIETALADPIAQFLAFGAFAPGDITNAQKVAVNNAAGADVANSLQTQGYYLQVLPASGTQRASRTSPPAKFWYLDRGSVQAITLDSIALQ